MARGVYAEHCEVSEREADFCARDISPDILSSRECEVHRTHLCSLFECLVPNVNTWIKAILRCQIQEAKCVL